MTPNKGFTKDKAKEALDMLLYYLEFSTHTVAGWICHRGQDPDDVWVVDLMIDGEHRRLM